MRARSATILIFLGVLIAGAYLASCLILGSLSEKMIDYFAANVNIPNVIYTRPAFASVRFSAPNAVTWNGITTDVTIVRDEILKKTERISVKVGEFTISLASLSKRTFVLNAKGLSADIVRKTAGVTSPGSQNATNRVEGGDLEMRIRFDVLDLDRIRTQMDDLSAELRRFFREGMTKIPIRFSGEQKFILKGKPYTVKVRVEHENDEYRLVIDETSLEQLGNIGTGISVTAGDRRVLAQNPLRMPQLLRIRDKAETLSRLARQKDPEFSEDAYRHILWSYLLTKTYGQEFSKEVTDAHESEADSEEMRKKGSRKLKAAQYQDYVNNAIGRSYAIKGYSESSIPGRVMTDPAVIKDDEIKKKFDPVKFSNYKKSIGQPASLSD